MSSRWRFSTTCVSIAAASVNCTTRTGTALSSTKCAALSRRAPATTSYWLASRSRTTSGCKMPCVLKLAASSFSVSSLKRLRGLVGDSCNCAMGRLRYLWLFWIVLFCIFISPFLVFESWLERNVGVCHMHGLPAAQRGGWHGCNFLAGCCGFGFGLGLFCL